MQRGTIKAHKLFKLYKALYDQKASGWLHLNHSSGSRKVYLLDGCPSRAFSTLASEGLFPRLVREGICSTVEAISLERKSHETDQLPEQVLLDLGIVSEARLNQTLADHIAETVWRSLSWRDGEFGWLAESQAPRFNVQVEPLTLLIMAGQFLISGPELAALWQTASNQRLILPELNQDESEALTDLLGPACVQAFKKGSQLDAFDFSNEQNPPKLKEAVAGLLLSGFFKAQQPTEQTTQQQITLPTEPVTQAHQKPSVKAPQAVQTPKMVQKPITQSSPPSSPSKPLKAKPSHNVTPPASFIDDRARVVTQAVSPASKVQSHAQPAQASTQAVKDRRVMKPPENWRSFSIGKNSIGKNSIGKKSVNSTPVAPPVSAPVAPPVSAPVAQPVSAPVAPPVSAPVAPPVSAPVAPVQAPLPPRRPQSNQRVKAKKPAPPKIQAKVDQFLELYERRADLNHYELLGVETQASTDEIRQVFKKLAGELHIDRFLRFDFSDDTLEAMKQLFIEFNKAYQVLIDDTQRQEYDLELKLANDSDGESVASGKRDLGQLLQAEQLVREAINFVKMGKVDLAEQRVNDALEINSDDPLGESVKIYIAGLNAKAKGASNAAIRPFIDRLEVLTNSYESREEPFLYLSVLYSYCEEYSRALKAVDKALEINPHFAEASSQKRHLQRLEQTKPKTTTTKPKKLSRFFGKG